MENLINQQRRVIFSDQGHGDFSTTRDGNIPQGGQKAKNWFQRPLLGLDQDSVSSEYAAAVAASAFALHSAEVAEENKNKKIREEFEASRDKIKTMTVDVKQGLSRRFSNKEAEASTRKMPQYARTTTRAAANAYPNNQMQSKANAWERAEMDKIRKRYEKMKSNIVAWENEKKLQAKLSMEKKKSEVEERKARNNQHYQSKVARIENIAKGSRVQADEKRRFEEAQVKEKAKKILSGRTAFKYCFCF